MGVICFFTGKLDFKNELPNIVKDLPFPKVNSFIVDKF